MKLRPAHEKALKATLRVTLFAALGACGGGGTAGSGGKPITNEPTPDAPPAATAPAGPTSEDECKAALKAAYPDGDKNWYDPNKPTPRAQTAVSDADLKRCCDELRAKDFPTEDYRDIGCCAASWESAKCTPWGPPMPPAMARA
jgi:hypothetical protein